MRAVRNLLKSIDSQVSIPFAAARVFSLPIRHIHVHLHRSVHTLPCRRNVIENQVKLDASGRPCGGIYKVLVCGKFPGIRPLLPYVPTQYSLFPT